MSAQSLRIRRAEASDWPTLRAIRTAVFVEEQGVSEAEEYDGHEDEAAHYLAYRGEEPVGVARWRITDSGVKFERLASLKAHRGCGVASALLLRMLADTDDLGRTRYMHAQVASRGFYERRGFVAQGEPFREAGIPHVRMFYQPDHAA